MPGSERRRRLALFAEAAVLLTAARVAVAVLPFRYIARSIGILIPPDGATHHVRSDALAVDAAHRVRWAIRAAVRRAPFAVVCLPQSVAAHRMLRRRGIPAVLHFGIVRTPDGLSSGHAWVDAAGIGVVGYPIDPATVTLGRLV